MISLTDGVVTLDPLRATDASEHLAGEDVELQRWLSGGRSTPEGVAAYLRTVEEHWRSQGPIFHFAIRFGVDLRLTGTIDVQLEQDYTRHGQANLAYGVYPQWRHRGIATRAVNLALRFLRDYTDAEEALIRADPRNQASVEVARRTGFTLVAASDGVGSLDHYERPV